MVKKMLLALCWSAVPLYSDTAAGDLKSKTESALALSG